MRKEKSRWPFPFTQAVSRHRWPSPLGLAVAVAVEATVAVAVGLAVEPVGFDGFFRSYGLYGRIMRMGMARITRMGALCVRKGVPGDRGKDPHKMGMRGIERSHTKE